jgi:hypothetical protein
MQMQIDNYRDVTMDEGYNLLLKGTWPAHFTVDMKKETMNAFIIHYREREDFSKCQRLTTMIEML